MRTSVFFRYGDEGFESAFSTLHLTNGVTLEISCGADGLVLKNSSLVPFAVYYYKDDSHFLFTSSFFEMENWLKARGIPLEFKRPLTKPYTSKMDVDRIRSCSTVESLTRYSQLHIHPDGSFETLPAKDEIFSIPLDSEEGARLLNSFIQKYKKIIRSFPSFTPTITGGLDTRILSGIWRGCENLSGEFYLKAVKPDGKNDVAKGQAEIRIANTILDRINYSFTRTEDPSDYTLCGILTEGNRTEENLNDKDFYYEFVAHHFSKRDLMYSRNHICPFMDNDYLRLAHPCPNFMRILLAYLLCPELLDIELYSFEFEPIYYLAEKFPELCEKAKAYIQKYRDILTL